MDYILVTGASSGLGREIAISLSMHYPVILCGRNEERLEKTKAECKNQAMIWRYDLSKIHTIESDLISWIKTNDVTISSFVHCAAFMKMLPLRSVNPSVLEEAYSTNVFAPELITKTLASKRVNGTNLKSVVFISSNISNRGATAFSVYGSSKSALDGVMRNLSVELAPKVRVNSILPGGMITEMTKDMFEDDALMKAFEKNNPLGIGSPAEIVPAVEFLLSERSKWITGQQITIDGGRTIDITERSK